METKVVEEKKRVKKLLESNLTQAEFKRNIWHVTAANDVTVEDLLKVDYWQHVSKNFSECDRIEVVAENRSFFVELFVLASAKNWTKTILMRDIVLIAEPGKLKTPGYKIDWNGVHKWRVLKGQEILSKDHDTEKEAQMWLVQHKKDIK